MAGEGESGAPGGEGEGPDLTPFQALCLGLAAQVQIALGHSPDPSSSAKKPPDLPAARQGIDLLTMLSSKTSGNLSPSESSLLSHLLTDLRLSYVRSGSE